MNDRARCLVIGGDSVIGRALAVRLAASGHEVVATTRSPDLSSFQRPLLDLAASPKSWRLPPDCGVAFICAGVTSQEACRNDPAGTASLNVTATSNLTHMLVEAGTFVVFLSTNLVFDGSKPAPTSGDYPNPKTEYGRQKAQAEKSILPLGNRVAVVRLSKVFHPDMPLLRNWAATLRSAQPIFPLTDLVCSPVSLNFASSALEQIGTAGVHGIFQISGDIDVSYAEIAKRLAQHLKADDRLVQPRSSSELNLHLERLPAHTTMDGAGISDRLSLALPTTWASIDSVLAKLPEI